ncbi:heavy metal translocating P-type ATPase [Pseudorhodoplanes sinuspersici]|uniref:P-type Zn(2+) transporter n=1 Tax=Pseudorhodoplanes sinuspersici TaxID=1235591 RepID=A0A1W6ZUV2_9HYPH|nr:heavy metal translocating P-type ATPase [Pseudorhodoplanes sinuspersici]ARQ01076.1 heavy metal translocating P-type ATPase [Pseudorhodoplanes sinuspersici]RKE72722.1 Cd2+/Zn2+-exporting ATPase [Pseudorhodoplanes sinuspersici]
MSDALTLSRYHVGGMDCSACGAKVDTAVRRLAGVSDVSVSVGTEMMMLTHKGDADLQAVEQAIRRLGYTVTPAGRAGDASAPMAAKPKQSWWQSRRALLVGACGSALLGAYGIGHWIPAYEKGAFLAALGIGLVPIARRAFAAARGGTPFSIEMLMSVAAVGAVAIGATEEAAAVVFLFLVGELLEGVAAGRARASIQGLAALVPKTALLWENGQTREVPADSLQVGAVISVRPGDRISADGVIIEGESGINEAPVTGESVPKQKKPGDKVFAGTVNGEANLRVRVTAAAQDNTISRVIRLVEEAQESKAPTQRFIDRFSTYYTPAVVAFAALVATMPPLLGGADWNEWIYKGLAVLLIGCPCALVISTPAAIAASLSAGARRGLLLKGGAVLEQLGSLTTIAFDKTGTLTEGRPKVTQIIPAQRDERQVLSLAAALEAGSNHPLALAIIERAKEAKVPLPPAGDSRAIPGKGVAGSVGGQKIFLGSPQAAAEIASLSDEHKALVTRLNEQGQTVSVVIAGDVVAGLIAMRDEPRVDARAGLASLREAGVKTLMLTGDNARTAEAIGRSLGIEVRAELLPEDKLKIVNELKSAGEKTGKVGDGINDAPALAAADVGIAMGGGTDVALETADAAVLHGRVGDVAAMVDLSRRTMRNIHQNIAIALGLKAVFLATTVAGVTGLWPAILADTGATVLVTANALRLLRTKQATPRLEGPG